ncbi:AI-2E family transporter [Aestuariispira insulae]|uniref:Putative PurR-regulated permease PerM n=1 Tax=Aestuariispira insulae TaxID=1461337 RepID=A0A3D9HMY9_9PROT|nr:AI-2E family transporter [Aestuariispira insulae]RED50877.1 putative PurR-regulated permease PerM [Aestuariispira insulae]
MTTEKKTYFWIGGFLVFLVLVYLLREVLLPFVAGMAIAYFLDPVCDWLEKHGCSRTIATTIVTVVFFVIFMLVLAIILPAAFAEIRAFTERAPTYAANIREKLAPLILLIQEQLAGQDFNSLTDKAAGISGTIFKGVGQIAGRLISGVGAIVNAISLIVLTPIVTFYLLRDWDHIVAKIDGWLPRCHLETIRGIARQIDQTLSGFARGQIMVCLLLGSFYGVGLAMVGLEFGLIIGFFTGLISFVPYFGMLVGFALGMGVAVAQFDQVLYIALVAGVFGIGQILEGYVLTPRLIGGRVGLHPVWIIFSLMAGGALFGFLGVLLAVPVTAVIGVLARFSLKKYMSSPLFNPVITNPAVSGQDDAMSEGRD